MYDLKHNADESRLSIRSSGCCLSVHTKPLRIVSHEKKLGMKQADCDCSWHTIR